MLNWLKNVGNKIWYEFTTQPQQKFYDEYDNAGEEGKRALLDENYPDEKRVVYEQTESGRTEEDYTYNPREIIKQDLNNPVDDEFLNNWNSLMKKNNKNVEDVRDCILKKANKRSKKYNALSDKKEYCVHSKGRRNTPNSINIANISDVSSHKSILKPKDNLKGKTQQGKTQQIGVSDVDTPSSSSINSSFNGSFVENEEHRKMKLSGQVVRK